MKKFYIVAALFLAGNVLYGQTFEDAARFSRLTNFGTARSAAMGGAFGALGGDLSTMSYNPAGMGVFRKSEVAFSPLLNFNTTKSGRGAIEDASFQIGNLGGVISFYSPNFDWRGFNFGISYTNLNNFNRKMKQLVPESYTSLTNKWAFESSGTPPEDLPNLSPFGANLAYNTYLIYNDENNDYFSILEMQAQNGDVYNEVVSQSKTIKEDGYQGEYAFSFGTNYKDKLYLGMTVGLQSLSYKTKSTYNEATPLDSPTGLDQFFYDEYQRIQGVGTNLKFGVIYRPIPEIRIGGAIHTPTWYNLSSRYSTAIGAWYNGTEAAIGRNEESYLSPSGELSVDYNMRTPWRAIVSLATVLKQKAIISVDYEYIDYTNANFSDASDGFDYYETNQGIKDYLKATHNFRAGAEYRFNSIFSLRAGYSFWDSPYHNNNKNYDKVQAISGGFGLNFGVFYCDAAYVHKYSKNETIFYSYFNPTLPLGNQYTESAPVKNKYLSNEAHLTFGVRF
ncbi:MAG: hypothetical protein RR259_02160 [Odoribacter sp.]